MEGFGETLGGQVLWSLASGLPMSLANNMDSPPEALCWARYALWGVYMEQKDKVPDLQNPRAVGKERPTLK